MDGSTKDRTPQEKDLDATPEPKDSDKDKLEGQEAEAETKAADEKAAAAVAAKLREIDGLKPIEPEPEPKKTEGSDDDGTTPADEAKAPAKKAGDETPAKDEKPQDKGKVKDEGKDGEDQPPAELTPRLQQTAKRVGLDADEIERLGDAAETVLSKLADGEDAISTRFAEIGRTMIEGQPPANGKTEAPAEAAGDLKKPDSEPKGIDLSKPFELTVNEDDFEDPESAEAWKTVMKPQLAMMNQMRQAIHEMKASVDDDMTFVKALRAQQATEMVERFFDGIKDEYGDIFGRGHTDTVAKEEQTARIKLVGQAEAYYVACNGLGQETRLEEALSSMLSATQAPRQQDIARKRLQREVKSRERQVSPKSARQKSGDEVRSTTKAESAVAAKMAEFGLTPV